MTRSGIHVRCRLERRAARRSTLSGSPNGRMQLRVSPMDPRRLSFVMPTVPSRQRASLRPQRHLRRLVSNRFHMLAVLSLQQSVPSPECLTRRPLSRLRSYLLLSTALTAASFRSKCGSTRRPPECSSQRCPAAAPQLGQ